LTPFNALQIALATAALSLIVQRLRVLLFEAQLDTDAFLDAFETALGSRQLELALHIAESCAPAFAARLATCALSNVEQPRLTKATIEATQGDLARAAFNGRAAIATLGRMAGPLALIGVILEIGTALHGGEGLAGLQRGFAMRIALQRSVLTFVLGLATSLVCFAAAAILQRNARQLVHALKRVAAAIDRAGAEGDEM
jgi:hypothetical protein